MGRTNLSEEDRKINKAITDFIIIPMIVLIGLYITAALVDSMLQWNNQTFRTLFTLVGGIPALALYFKGKMSEYGFFRSN
jgi:hypothetical protein